MDGSPSSILMLGLGNGTFAGSPSLMLTLGYGISAVVSGPTATFTETVDFGYTLVDEVNFDAVRVRDISFRATDEETVDF